MAGLDFPWPFPDPPVRAAVRLGAVHALATVADDHNSSREDRQMCIDVLCSYLRTPHKPEPSAEDDPDGNITWHANREVRHTILRTIASHLRPDGTATTWQGHTFDLRAITIDLDLNSARFPQGSTLDVSNAVFSGGDVSFPRAEFSGGHVTFLASFAEGFVFVGEASGDVAGVVEELSDYRLRRLLGDTGNSPRPAARTEHLADGLVWARRRSARAWGVRVELALPRLSSPSGTYRSAPASTSRCTISRSACVTLWTGISNGGPPTSVLRSLGTATPPCR